MALFLTPTQKTERHASLEKAWCPQEPSACQWWRNLSRGHRPQRGKTVAWGNDRVAMEAAHYWSCSKVAVGLVVWPEAQMELLCRAAGLLWWTEMENQNAEVKCLLTDSAFQCCFRTPRSVKPNGLPSWRRRQVYRVQLQSRAGKDGFGVGRQEVGNCQFTPWLLSFHIYLHYEFLIQQLLVICGWLLSASNMTSLNWDVLSVK